MKMRDAKGRNKGSGYGRLFGDDRIGELFSKAQATVISNGSELERILLSYTQNIKNLEFFISEIENGSDEIYKDGVYVCTKRILQKSKYSINGIEPDLLIFIVQKRRICKVIELKDGDGFDTKKSDAEQQHLEKFSKEFGCQVPFTTEYYICSFNQMDKETIYTGLKKKFEMEHILTGRELCEILDIEYEEIIAIREADAADNIRYFVKEMLSIDCVREVIEELKNNGEIK